ncbi:hypothetical protein Q5P01_001077 [Channa striata]|uniref:Uncharacterized protein n=1 Tax=Channa striata TaxID=64152 RepID=A0AA88T6S0_CHASR|nr:hypothetical protein Q5P01_001077 [Channa striata]
MTVDSPPRPPGELATRIRFSLGPHEPRQRTFVWRTSGERDVLSRGGLRSDGSPPSLLVELLNAADPDFHPPLRLTSEQPSRSVSSRAGNAETGRRAATLYLCVWTAEEQRAPLSPPPPPGSRFRTEEEHAAAGFGGIAEDLPAEEAPRSQKCLAQWDSKTSKG